MQRKKKGSSVPPRVMNVQRGCNKAIVKDEGTNPVPPPPPPTSSSPTCCTKLSGETSSISGRAMSMRYPPLSANLASSSSRKFSYSSEYVHMS